MAMIRCRYGTLRQLIILRKGHQTVPNLAIGARLLHTGTTTTAASKQDIAASSSTSRDAASHLNQTTEFSKPTRGLNALRSLKKRGKSEANDTAGDGKQRVILGQSSQLPIRARFAPSPTGYIHLGSLRTALFNNIAARASTGGSFILRIEDTDQNRIVHDAEDRLLEDLSWAGLKWDEGPDCGGPYGPYRQSERLPIYKKHIEKLIDDGNAYRCFCTAEQLETQKRHLHDAGQPTFYNGTCRSINADESSKRAENGEAHVVRFRSDKFGRPKLRDAIYGPFQKKDGEEDFILLKSDGFPTYHFANVVDDHLMKITHVIRGEEWLISTPKHVALYQAFGWEPPTFAHLGLLINEDGTKLSKRNDSVNLSKYKNGDVLPMALLAWLANLGSSFSTGVKPPRSVEDVADALTFKFTRGGIKLNFGKLTHFNTKYRDVLLRNPSSLSDRERHLLDYHLIQPTLRAVESGTISGTDTWHDTPLIPIPQLVNEDTAATYIHKVLSNSDGGFQEPSTLISQHPYLFWRVPEAVYQESLLSAESIDTRILDALADVLAVPEYWQPHAETNPTQALRQRLEPKGIQTITMYNVLRLVGAGGQDVVSQSSGRMFTLFGREEWKIRLDIVQRLLKQQ